MGELQVEVEPAEVGLDGGRLQRLTRYLDGLVEAGRVPGWLAVVSRGGKVAYLERGGHRHMEDQLPVETDTVFRIYSMTKPVTSVAAMMLVEEGLLELTTPVGDLVPVAPRPARLRGRPRPQAGHRSRRRAHPALAPAHAHRRAHLRLPPGAPGATPCCARPGTSGASPRSTSRPPSTCSPGSPCSSSPAPSGTTRSRPTCSGASSRWPRGCRSTASSPSASSPRSGMTDTSFGLRRRRGRRPPGPPLRRHADRPVGPARRPRQPASPAPP